jgi:glyoxylase-like metal-dependent hydrolase (beta-lactamase superfamily II)
LEDGEIYTAAGIRMQVRVIAGHSSGHVVYLIEDCDPMTVFVGDVIFSGSIGRTDFPDGDFNQLAEGIRKILYTLPDSTILLPGHGPSTTVGEEKRSNPFVRRAS